MGIDVPQANSNSFCNDDDKNILTENANESSSVFPQNIDTGGDDTCLAANDVEAQSIDESNKDGGISISIGSADTSQSSADIPVSLAVNDTSSIPPPRQQQQQQQQQQSSPDDADETIADQRYTITWASIARGEKWCGTTIPRFTWLLVLFVLLSALFSSVGYILQSLGL